MVNDKIQSNCEKETCSRKQALAIRDKQDQVDARASFARKQDTFKNQFEKIDTELPWQLYQNCADKKKEAASSFCPFAPVESFLVAKVNIRVVTWPPLAQGRIRTRVSRLEPSR